MSNPRTKPLIAKNRGGLTKRSVPKNNETGVSTGVNIDNLDISGRNVRQRSNRRLDGQQHPDSFDHSPLKCEIVQTAGMDAGKGGTLTSSSARRRKCDDDTVGTADEQTRRNTPELLAPLLQRHQPGESLKAEMQLVVQR